MSESSCPIWCAPQAIKRLPGKVIAIAIFQLLALIFEISLNGIDKMIPK